MANSRHQNNPEIIQVRNARIWELRTLENWSQAKIAADVNVSQFTVSTVLKKQAAAYSKKFWKKFDHEKTLQILDLKRVAHELWDSWVASKQPGKTMRQMGVTDSDKGVKQIELKDQYGNPQYLDLYMKALKEIRQIMGINAPLQTENTTKIIVDKEYETSRDGLLDGLYRQHNDAAPGGTVS